MCAKRFFYNKPGAYKDIKIARSSRYFRFYCFLFLNDGRDFSLVTCVGTNLFEMSTGKSGGDDSSKMYLYLHVLFVCHGVRFPSKKITLLAFFYHEYLTKFGKTVKLSCYLFFSLFQRNFSVRFMHCATEEINCYEVKLSLFVRHSNVA